MKDEVIHLLNNCFKIKTCLFALSDLLCNQRLSHRCRTGIKYMYLCIWMILQKKVHAKHCTVVRTTQFCRQRDRIEMLSPTVKCRSVHFRWRAAGLRTVWTLLHLHQKVKTIKCLIIHKLFPVYRKMQCRMCKMRILFHILRKFPTTVNNDPVIYHIIRSFPFHLLSFI